MLSMTFSSTKEKGIMSQKVFNGAGEVIVEHVMTITEIEKTLGKRIRDMDSSNHAGEIRTKPGRKVEVSDAAAND